MGTVLRICVRYEAVQGGNYFVWTFLSRSIRLRDMFSISYLNTIRRTELLAILNLFPKGCRVLEIGAGTGSRLLI